MGAAGRKWEALSRKAGDLIGPFSSCFTTGMGDAVGLTREALLGGAEIIVCVGGDGTLNEVVNGYMAGDAPLRNGAVIGVIPIGTGCDLAKTLQIPKDPDKALELVRAGNSRLFDIGRLAYRDHAGRTDTRYFHNVASFGLGGEVVERVNRTSKAFGGFASFIWATLVSLLLYSRKRIRLKVGDGPEEDLLVWNVAVANGQYHGGGMWIAPDANARDGLFHVTVIGDMGLGKVLWNLPRLYNGRVLEVDKVRSLTARRIAATSDQEVLLDVDGEQPGRLPATIDILPSALPLLTPPFPNQPMAATENSDECGNAGSFTSRE